MVCFQFHFHFTFLFIFSFFVSHFSFFVYHFLFFVFQCSVFGFFVFRSRFFEFIFFFFFLWRSAPGELCSPALVLFYFILTNANFEYQACHLVRYILLIKLISKNVTGRLSSSRKTIFFCKIYNNLSKTFQSEKLTRLLS